MTLRILGVTVRIHFLLPLLWLFSAVTGAGQSILASLIALFVHEMGHLLFAKALRTPMEDMEVTPFGAVMTLAEPAALPALNDLMLSAAGPLFSFLGCMASAALYQWNVLSYATAQAFVHANALLLFVNLLPALPLDGGRMLRALLSHFLPPARVTKALLWVGRLMGFILMGVSLLFALRGQLLLAPAFAGVYLLYAAAQEGKQATSRYITGLIARRQKLRHNQTLAVDFLAASEDMPVRALLRHLAAGKYHVVRVLRADGQGLCGTLEEAALCEAILSKAEQTLGEVVKGEV